MIDLIGIYKVKNYQDVHLIEICVKTNPENVDIARITQEIVGIGKSCWQSPWNENYLNENGDKIIGDYFKIPQNQISTRFIFYFHNLDFTKPLITQFANLELTHPTEMPSRLENLVNYEEPD